MGAHSSTQIPSVVIHFPSAAEFSNLWGGVTPPTPPAIYVPVLFSIMSVIKYLEKVLFTSIIIELNCHTAVELHVDKNHVVIQAKTSQIKRSIV